MHSINCCCDSAIIANQTLQKIHHFPSCPLGESAQLTWLSPALTPLKSLAISIFNGSSSLIRPACKPAVGGLPSATVTSTALTLPHKHQSSWCRPLPSCSGKNHNTQGAKVITPLMTYGFHSQVKSSASQATHSSRRTYLNTGMSTVEMRNCRNTRQRHNTSSQCASSMS